MHHDDRSSSGAGIVAAVLLLLVILFIGAVGAGVGFFYVRGVPVAGPMPVSMKKAAVGGTATPTLASAEALVVGKFELSDLDLKDALESPTLAIAPQGNVLLAYASQAGPEERTLSLVRSVDGTTFGEAKVLRKTKIFTAVSQSRGKEVKRPLRMMPKLAVGGSKVFLGWIEPNEDNTTVIFYVAESTDEGVTFGDPIRVHESDGARPNFLALAADAQGNVVASWLDIRAGIPQPFAAVKKAGESAFSIETQVYSSPNEAGVCPCCPTAALIGLDEQVYVAFRNQLEGFRDIYVGQRPLQGEGEFPPPMPVMSKPTWTFDGCPHDGPSLAADTLNLYVTWMDASSGAPRCYYSKKPLGGGNFDPPQLLNPQSDSAEGNAKIVSTGDGVIAVWEQAATSSSDEPAAGGGGHAHGAASGGSRAIYLATAMRVQGPQGTSLAWEPARPIAMVEGAFQSRPVVVTQPGGHTYAAWNELDEQGKRVVVARLSQ
jgi:hypothetical protein